MNRFTCISRPYLDALLAIAPSNHIRHYLNGVFINPKGYLEATNNIRALRIQTGKKTQTPTLLTHPVIADAMSIHSGAIHYDHEWRELGGLHVSNPLEEYGCSQYPDLGRIFANFTLEPVHEKIIKSSKYKKAVKDWEAILNIIFQEQKSFSVGLNLRNNCLIFQCDNIQMAASLQ